MTILTKNNSIGSENGEWKIASAKNETSETF